MKRTHIAFFSTPQFPCVHPTLSLVKELSRQGHRVTHVTSKRFASKVLGAGAEFVQSPDFPNRFTADIHKKEAGPLLSLEEDYTDLATATLSEVTSFYEENKPDLIVYDLVCLAGRVLANKWSIPAIQTSPAFVFDRRSIQQQLTHSDFCRATLEECRINDRFLERYGIYGDSLTHREPLNILFYPRELQLEGTESDSSFLYAPRCVGEQPYERSWRPPEGGKKVVLVSTSTYYVQGPDYFHMCVEALSGLDCHVVLAIGDNNKPSSFNPLPSGFEIIQGIPQIQVLPFAALLICLGGMVTTVEALYHGVPMLMMTHGHPEPELYADKNTRLGIGYHLRKTEMNSEALREAITRISRDDDVLTNVGQLQRSIKGSPTPEAITNRMMEYIHH